MKLYREVKASERLPKSNGEYVVCLKANLGFDLMNYWKSYDSESSPIEDYYNDEQLKDDWINTVDFWLEPIEITEEEIRDILDDYIRFNASGPVGNAWISRDSINESVKAILSKLKGDE